MSTVLHQILAQGDRNLLEGTMEKDRTTTCYFPKFSCKSITACVSAVTAPYLEVLPDIPHAAFDEQFPRLLL